MGEPIDKVKRGKKEIFVDNFIGGIAWGLGLVIGGTLVLALLGFTLRHVNLVPVVGDFVNEIVIFVRENQPQTVTPQPYEALPQAPQRFQQ